MIVANLKSRIPQIIAVLPDQVDDAIKESTEAIVEGAKERVPVDTGDLRDAIHTEQVEGGWSVVAGDNDSFYGHIIEFGGANTPAQPFLIPAYEAEYAPMIDRVKDALGDL